jgi:hypothetical protein
METWNHRRENGLGSSVITLLHRNLLKLARKGVLPEWSSAQQKLSGKEKENDT